MTTLEDYISVIDGMDGGLTKGKDHINLIQPMTDLRNTNNIDYKLQVLHERMEAFHLQKYHIMGISVISPIIIGIIILTILALYWRGEKNKMRVILNK